MRAFLGEDFIYIYGTYSTPTLSGMNEKPKSTEDETLLKDGLVARDGTLRLDLGCFLQASPALYVLLSQAGEERSMWGWGDDSPGREL